MTMRTLWKLATFGMVAALLPLATLSASAAQTVDIERPGSPSFVTAEIDAAGTVLLSWGPSTDNVGVVDSRVLRNGVELLRTGDARRLMVLADLPVGDSFLQLQSIDAAGNESVRTAPVLVNLPTRFVSAPALLYSNWFNPIVQLYLSVSASQRPSLTGVAVWRNGVEFTTLPFDAVIFDQTSPPYVSLDGLPHGRSFLQLQFIGAGGTRSVKSAPLAVDVDITPPAAPLDVRASIRECEGLDGTQCVDVTSALATTEGGEGCVLNRNLGPTYFAYGPPQNDPDDPTRFKAFDYGPAPSISYYQLSCFDAAGNRSARSAPAKIVIDDPG